MKLLFLLIFIPIVSFSQTKFNSEVNASGNGFRILYENDFFSETDIYYTQGIRLYFQNSIIKKSPIDKILPSYNEGKDFSGIYIVHEGFTPTSIRRDTILTNDRPFAGLIYLGEYKQSISVSEKKVKTTEFIFGMMGPFAKGYETQKGIHEIINNIEPLGWQFQIKNNLLINYYSTQEKYFIASNYFDLSGAFLTGIGSYKDFLGLGLKSNIGKHQSIFIDEKSKVQYFFTGYVRTDLVFYNAALQGGIFQRKNPYVIAPSNINPVVLASGIAFTFAYKNISATYAKNWLSPEFNGGLHHGWGTIDLRFNW